MAKMWITEFGVLPADTRGHILHIPPFPSPLAVQVVDFTAGHAEGTAFNIDTRYVRIVADTQCNFTVGVTPVATTADAMLPAMTVEYIGVKPTHKVSVV